MFEDALNEAVLFCAFLIGFPVALWVALWAIWSVTCKVVKVVKRWKGGK